MLAQIIPVDGPGGSIDNSLPGSGGRPDNSLPQLPGAPDNSLPKPPGGVFPPLGPSHPIAPAPGVPPGVIWPPIGKPPTWGGSRPGGGGKPPRPGHELPETPSTKPTPPSPDNSLPGKPAHDGRFWVVAGIPGVGWRYVCVDISLVPDNTLPETPTDPAAPDQGLPSTEPTPTPTTRRG